MRAFTRGRKKIAVTRAKSLRDLFASCRVIILAVKPMDLDSVLADCGRFASRRHLLVSAAAGYPLKKLSRRLRRAKVACAMPNVNALAGKSFTALCFGKKWANAERRVVTGIFSAVGETVELRGKDLDAFMHASACGPAIMAYLAQALERSFASLGLKQGLARKTVLSLLKGSAEAMETGRLSADGLMGLVKTKGGFTERLLKALEAGRVSERVARAYKEGAGR